MCGITSRASTPHMAHYKDQGEARTKLEACSDFRGQVFWSKKLSFANQRWGLQKWLPYPTCAKDSGSIYPSSGLLATWVKRQKFMKYQLYTRFCAVKNNSLFISKGCLISALGHSSGHEGWRGTITIALFSPIHTRILLLGYLMDKQTKKLKDHPRDSNKKRINWQLVFQLKILTLIQTVS